MSKNDGPATSRAEARLARRAAKADKQKEKRVRFRQETPPDQQPRSAATPSDTKNARQKFVPSPAGKQSRTSVDVGSIFARPMTYEMTYADKAGDWSWGPRWSDSDHGEHIEPALRAFTAKTWGEIDRETANGHRKHHAQDVASFCKEAQDRWTELEIEEDTAFRFRLTNKRRMWGYRVVAHWCFVWWDPHHKVYPTEPHNT